MDLLGYNFRLPDINCAIGISQIKKLNRFLKKRDQISRIYDKFFSDKAISELLKNLFLRVHNSNKKIDVAIICDEAQETFVKKIDKEPSELRNGKSVRSAIDSGYERAITTIVDANLTTGIAAAVLYQYGSGPIKGFATVLFWGIIVSMFTAIIVTRFVFDFVTSRKNIEKLSI